jgi:VanZ family protein
MTFKRVLKGVCLAVLILLVFVGLGPARWQPRSGLGWEIDHFVGYFFITLMFCLAWPRPFVVGGILMVFAVLLEGAQAFMPDRSSYYMAAVVSAAGVLTAALVAELFIRAWRRFGSKGAVSAEGSSPPF